ncbi:histone H1-like [Anopheles marshallii]|uniref:histone H1-like n=1 Tax=Anopheles marshallii TaxID=1521116 RepID=UPI00237B2B47|nr:histone H1-like [Anopheles marshallii]
MAKEVTQSVAKPMEVKKITYADETGPKTISAELKKESQFITTTVTSNQQSKATKKSYEQMIIDAITENDPRRKGISFTLIKKFIKGKYQIEGEITSYVKKAFEKLSSKNTVERVSGMAGMSGSIRLTKAHIAEVSKQQKLAAKAKPKIAKPPKKQATKNEKDKNNNEKKKGKAVKTKPTLHAKPSTKKTAITKTKIARSGGKVRLSIVTSTDPSPSTSAKTAKAKKNGSKTTAAAEKSAKPKGKKNVSAKPKPAKAHSEEKE